MADKCSVVVFLKFRLIDIIIFVLRMAVRSE